MNIVDILDWLDETQPVFTDNLRDYFGVDDLLSLDEDDLFNAICDNDRVYEMLLAEFPEYFEITSSTCTCGISPKVTAISCDTELDDVETIMSYVEDELSGADIRNITYHEKIDKIYLIVYDNAGQIYEYTIPKSDLEHSEDPVSYIVDFVSSDLDLG